MHNSAKTTNKKLPLQKQRIKDAYNEDQAQEVLHLWEQL